MSSPHGIANRQHSGNRLEQRIAIDHDGTIVARSGKVEYGQGIRTGFARIVADELAVPVTLVRVELGETDRVPWDMGTFGSLSTATDGAILQSAAAHARKLLLKRASTRLGVPIAQLRTNAGTIAASDGRSITYAELVRSRPLRGRIPRDIADAGTERATGETTQRLEAVAIVTGTARYASDVRLPHMLYGHVLHAPHSGSRLLALEDHAARALPGVVEIVHEGDFVGVVAEREEQAYAATRALIAQWGEPEAPLAAPIAIHLRHDAGVEAGLAAGCVRLTKTYHVPHIAHASIFPSAAVADVRSDCADLYVATQQPFGLRDEAAALLHLPPHCVRVHPQFMGGQFGRGNVADAALDALRLSRAVQRPVLVQWTREEEFALSPHRPALDAQIDAALDTSGAIIAWRSHIRTNPHTYGDAAMPPQFVAMTSGRNAIPAYQVGAAEVLLEVVTSDVRTGAYRSLAAAPNVFAIESFVDELAHQSGRDSLQWRLHLADDPRLRRVLETVQRRSNWDYSRVHGHCRGFGVACAVYNGTYVAEVAEVIIAEGGDIRLQRVWCAIDAGRLVNPDGARNQIEGAVQQAASWTLLEKLGVEHGVVATLTWNEYPIATCADAPLEIDVVFVGDNSEPPSGIGEAGCVPTAAAIANAAFAATGIRLRALPLRRHDGAVQSQCAV